MVLKETSLTNHFIQIIKKSQDLENNIKNRLFINKERSLSIKKDKLDKKIF